jgi:hypothetical protein
MDILPPLVADGQAPELAQPRQRALYHPAVPAQLLAGLDAFARDADPDVASRQGPATAGDVIRFVGVQLAWPSPALPARAPDGGYPVDQCLEHGAVMAVGAGQVPRQWRPASVDHKMALRARFAAIRRVRPGGGSPLYSAVTSQGVVGLDRTGWGAARQPPWGSAPSKRLSPQPGALPWMSRLRIEPRLTHKAMDLLAAE